MTENTKTEFKCQFCDSNFTRSYNLKRHMERKHAQQKVIISQDKVIIPQQKVIISKDKVIISKDKVIIPAQKVNILETDGLSCTKCERVFKKQWICTRHEKKCSSTINPLECTFCHKIYSTKQSKFVHMKKCKDQAIVLYNNNSDANTNANANTAESLVTNNITNNNNINNINNNNTNNINNGTINYNIVIYDEKKTNFIKEHITYEKLKFLLNTNTDETVFSKYNNHLMEKEENNCIRKSDKRSNYSQIHIGENKWKNIPDKKIYPEIISQIAGDMQDIVNDKFENLKSKEKLFDLLDYFIFKETSDDDKETERRYKKIYNLIIEEQKLYAINAARNEN